MNGVVRYLRGNNNDPEIIASGPSSLTSIDKLAKGLGWFSFALGAAEILAGRRIAAALGLRDKTGMIHAFGAREIATGMLTLSIDKGVGLWSRAAGDVMDLMLVATALEAPHPRQRQNAKLALFAIAGITALDVIAARAVAAQSARETTPRTFDDRSGFPRSIAASKGAARDFRPPKDMRNSLRGVT
jgi:hypothetical protein